MNLVVVLVGFILWIMKINLAKILETEIITTNDVVETRVLSKTKKLLTKTCQRRTNITQ